MNREFRTHARISVKFYLTVLGRGLLATLLAAAQAPLANAQENATPTPAAVEAQPAGQGWFGTTTRDLDAASIKALGLDQEHALLVEVTIEDGAADKAGVKAGDVILSLNGKAVPDQGGFTREI